MEREIAKSILHGVANQLFAALFIVTAQMYKATGASRVAWFQFIGAMSMISVSCFVVLSVSNKTDTHVLNFRERIFLESFVPITLLLIVVEYYPNFSIYELSASFAFSFIAVQILMVGIFIPVAWYLIRISDKPLTQDFHEQS